MDEGTLFTKMILWSGFMTSGIKKVSYYLKTIITQNFIWSNNIFNLVGKI